MSVFFSYVQPTKDGAVYTVISVNDNKVDHTYYGRAMLTTYKDAILSLIFDITERNKDTLDGLVLIIPKQDNRDKIIEEIKNEPKFKHISISIILPSQIGSGSIIYEGFKKYIEMAG